MIRLFQKQKVAWDLLHDEITREIVYGWWAGWGKSVLGTYWLAEQIASKPGSTWALGRSELKKIKLSTLITFKRTLKEFWFSEDSYKYDDQKGVMTFKNGCMVVLVDLAYNPSDPEFDRLWSTEYTGWFIDEAQEIDDKARQILNSRLRNLTGAVLYIWKSKKEAEDWIKENNKGVLNYIDILDEWQVVLWKQEIPKLFMSCNPGLNFIYTDFYKPWKNSELPENRAFIQSLPRDNPFLPKSYIENLELLDRVSKERLLHGNFDYIDDPGLLFDIDMINNSIKETPTKPWEYYLSIDAARQGKDSTEIGIWNWLHLERVQTIDKWSLTIQAEVIRNVANKYDVDIDNIIVDEVWVWGWLVDILGCRWFIGNASAIHPYASKLLAYKKRNYANLRTQAFFYLQQYMRDSKISMNLEWKQKEDMIEELMFIRQIEIDNDSKIKIEGKKDIKKKLWRSPDLADMVSMRMWWLIKSHELWETPTEDVENEEETDEFLKWLMEDEEEEVNELDLEVY